jgi:hypothetical protein
MAKEISPTPWRTWNLGESNLLNKIWHPLEENPASIAADGVDNN